MTEEPTKDHGRRWELTLAQKQLIAFILVLAAANTAYRLAYASGFQQTAALYIGVPTVLAVGLAMVPRSRSATGVALRGSTLATLIAGVVLPEGLLCLLFVLPLVLLVAVIVGGAVDASRRRRNGQGPTLMAITLPLLILSLEGVLGSPFDAGDRATADLVVHVPPVSVAEALASPPTFASDLPPFLTVGFNRPAGATGSGIQVGDRRVIDFTGGSHDDHPLGLAALIDESRIDHRSQMELTVVESQPGRVVFRVDHDGTMLARWADLERAVVSWEPMDATTTRVSWRLDYDRLVFPTAYFAPVQRYGMDQAAGYLLESVILEQLR